MKEKEGRLSMAGRHPNSYFILWTIYLSMRTSIMQATRHRLSADTDLSQVSSAASPK